jgi:hypothetical protein
MEEAEMTIIDCGGTGGVGNADELGRETFSMPDRHQFSMRDGDLYLTMHGKLFPSRGGGECGQSFTEINVSEHFRQLIREELAALRK